MRSNFEEAKKIYDKDKNLEEHADQTYINRLADLLKSYSNMKLNEARKLQKELENPEFKSELKLEKTLDEDESIATSYIDLLMNQFKEKLTPIAANDLAQYFLNRAAARFLKLKLELDKRIFIDRISKDEIIQSMCNKVCELLEFSLAQNPKLTSQSEKENYLNNLRLTFQVLVQSTKELEFSSPLLYPLPLREKIYSLLGHQISYRIELIEALENINEDIADDRNPASIALAAINHSLNNQEFKLSENQKSALSLSLMASSLSFMIYCYIEGMNSKIADKTISDCAREINNSICKNALFKPRRVSADNNVGFEVRHHFVFRNLIDLKWIESYNRAEAMFLGAIFYLDLYRKYPNIALPSLTILYSKPYELTKQSGDYISDKNFIFPLMLKDYFEYVFNQNSIFILHKYHLDLSMLYSKFAYLIDKNIETLKKLSVAPQFHEVKEWIINELGALKKELDSKFRPREEDAKFKEFARARKIPTGITQIISSYLDNSKEFKVEENFLPESPRLFSSTMSKEQQISVVLKKFNKFIKNIDNFLLNKITQESKSPDDAGIKQQLKNRLSSAFNACKDTKTSSETLRRLIASSETGEIGLVYQALIKDSPTNPALPSLQEYKDLLNEAAKIELPVIPLLSTQILRK